MTLHFGLLSSLPSQVKIVVFIGSRNSDHLRELMRIAEFKGRAAYRIENASELQPRWFAGVDEIGVVVGGADLQNVARAAIDRLNQFAAAEQRGMLEGVAQ